MNGGSAEADSSSFAGASNEENRRLDPSRRLQAVRCPDGCGLCLLVRCTPAGRLDGESFRPLGEESHGTDTEDAARIQVGPCANGAMHPPICHRGQRPAERDGRWF